MKIIKSGVAVDQESWYALVTCEACMAELGIVYGDLTFPSQEEPEWLKKVNKAVSSLMPPAKVRMASVRCPECKKQCDVTVPVFKASIC